MKNIVKVYSVALVAVFILTAATCSGQSGGGSSSGGGRTLNSADDLKKYLDSQPVNGPDKPIRVTMSANDPMLPKIVEAINSAGKYVSLNLSGNALTEIPNKAFSRCKLLVGITIPNSVEIIYNSAFENCTSLTSITIPNSVEIIDNLAFFRCTSLTSVIFATGSNITDSNFGEFAFPEGSYGDGGNTLKTAYSTGKAGTYTRSANGSTWTKQ